MNAQELAVHIEVAIGEECATFAPVPGASRCVAVHDAARIAAHTALDLLTEPPDVVAARRVLLGVLGVAAGVTLSLVAAKVYGCW